MAEMEGNMETKDWILLISPIICNGLLIFILQVIFEKKQKIREKKYEYVAIMQKKIDYSLVLFMNTIQATGDDLKQNEYLTQYINSYCDIFYYYQQNQKIFAALKKQMDELIDIHHQIKSNEHRLKNPNERLDTLKIIEINLRKIFKILQSIQTYCVEYKI